MSKEKKIINFSHKEVAEALARKQGLTEGIWMLSVEFALSAGNVGVSKDDIRPAAIIPVVQFALTQVDEENALTIDASKLAK